MNRDQIEGGLRHLRGRGQTALGAVAGRVRPQAEGAFNQVVGGAQYAYGRGRRAAEELSRDGTVLAGEIGAHGRQAYDGARARGRQVLHRAETHRTETLLVVAGLAFVVGWLAKGRR
ncbi:hypothetical protein OPKNFCMD_2678 [Methylobacterium crusticola]|uniref:CsbD family protein n=1 Tax=Methylobacterium crusticola TaxID=1697972 RepID=A0ABQ4QZF3_9HYPH|nr:CsbD family protein [Methylobacterium crusticola]GJD49942.1 hypothetical protein OPKNFCMD_2678 [Methylobacterium crusticola]